jgi:hypothetical protein
VIDAPSMDLQWSVPEAMAHSKCGWTPFAGMRLQGRAVRVVLRGKTAMLDGAVYALPGEGRNVCPARTTTPTHPRHPPHFFCSSHPFCRRHGPCPCPRRHGPGGGCAGYLSCPFAGFPQARRR